MMHSFYSWGGGWMMLIWWFVIAIGIGALIKWLPSLAGPSESEGRDRAVEELRRRYANSEIDEDEFRKKLNTLKDV